MRYDLPVPAVPEIIILKGGGLSASKCSHTVVYTWSCLPRGLQGSAKVVNACCAACCRWWETNDGASSRLGYV